jgi:hydroxypyruvate reductase
MKRSLEQLRRDALAIWKAGVDAVDSRQLVRQALKCEASSLVIDDDEVLPLDRIRRIAVVGAGKAGAGMAAAVEEVLGAELIAEKQLVGWVNVPEDTVRPLARIHLHGARPAGVNEPTEAGAIGSKRILEIVESLGPDDLCLCLISGGGSALMPAPVDAISLADKLAVTRHLSAAGANIQELNAVRKQLSRIKGGGLARACRAGRLVSLIISDVLGDPLDVIASGPTVEDTSTPEQALAVLERFDGRRAGISQRVFDYLRGKHGAPPRPTTQVTNLIIGNNATAVDASGEEAVRLGYSPAMVSAAASEGPAEEIGRHLASMALRMRDETGPDCLISGGEPTVRLAPKEIRGLGGRNQQLVLAALEQLQNDGASGLVLLSGGTDGEDGPTDAAGALLDETVLSESRQRGLDPADCLARSDAYHFFQPLEALVKTGPTGTNVCDVRVVVVSRVEQHR